MNYVLEKIAHTILKGHKEELQRDIDLSVWSYIHFFGMSEQLH